MPFYFTTTATNCTTVQTWNQWVALTTTMSTLGTWGAWANECEQFHSDLNAQGAQLAAYRAIREHEANRAREREFEANDRAQALLLGYLNESQRAELAVHQSFTVCGKSGRRYRIKRGACMIGNVEVLHENGAVLYRLCAHDRQYGTPLDDQLLAQKFYLEHHEEEFLTVANHS